MTNKKYASPPFIKTVELASIIQIEMLQEHVAGWLDDRSVEHSSLCNFQLLFWQEGIGWYSVLLLSDEGNLWSMMPKLVISSGTCSSGLQGMSQGSELYFITSRLNFPAGDLTHRLHHKRRLIVPL